MKTFKEIADQARKEDLDELVIDTFSEQASDLNNQGKEKQVEFLVHTYGQSYVEDYLR